MAEIKDWKYTLLGTDENEHDIKHLIGIYDRDRFRARVVFMNSHKTRFQYNKTILFEDPESDDFDIVVFRIKYGISVTNIKYRHSKRMTTFRYRKKNGFWLCTRNGITRPMSFDLYEFQNIHPFLQERFAWYRCMVENNIRFNYHLTPQKILNKRLFSLDKILKHYYDMPIQTSKMLFSIKDVISNEGDMPKIIWDLRSYKRFLLKIENLKPEWIMDHYHLFMDTLHMAKNLDKRINCSWGIKRLIKEHDDWSEELNRIIYIEDNRDLGNRDVYKKFAEETGYDIIETTRDLAQEGIKQSHCVGGYAARVDGGSCSIFHIKGYTLELGCVDYDFDDDENKLFKLTNKQFRGYGNCKVPEEIYNEVNLAIEDFNEKYKDTDYLKTTKFGTLRMSSNDLVFDNFDDDLPF